MTEGPAGPSVIASGQSWGTRVMAPCRQARPQAPQPSQAAMLTVTPSLPTLIACWGAGIFAQQAVVALTGLAARLYPDPGLHLTAEAEIQCARGAGSGTAAAIAALATGEIQHWGTGDGAAVIFGAIGRFDEAVGTRLEAVATTGAEGEELGLVDGPGRACLMADHLGSAGAPPCVCQPATEKMRHAHLYTY